MSRVDRPRKRSRALLDGLGLGLLKSLSWLPLPIGHALGAGIGWLAWHTSTRMRHTARVNLALCFPEQSLRWRERTAKRSFIEMGKAMTEAPRLWRLGPEAIRRHAHNAPFPGIDSSPPAPPDTASIERHTLERPLPRDSAPSDHAGSPGNSHESLAPPPGRATLIASPHLGSWEFAGLACATHAPMTSLYSPLKNKRVDAWVHRSRSVTGATLAPADREGLRLLRKALDRGEFVGILPDQSPKGASGVYAPFFGRPALTMTLLSRLSQHCGGVPVIFIAAERLSWGRGYRFHSVIAGRDGVPALTGNAQDDAATINAAVEALIRRCPAQYNWAYKRFIPAPPGYTDPYRA